MKCAPAFGLVHGGYTSALLELLEAFGMQSCEGEGLLAAIVSRGLPVPKRKLSRGQVQVFDMPPRTAKANRTLA